jgi:hypothetical protein
VQVVNFVAKGTIEEGMLSVLAFKKSLFAGVLDGGRSEVILEGTRLAKFMESVERVTAHLDPDVDPVRPVEADAMIDSTDVEALPVTGVDAVVPSPPSAASWTPLLEAGIQLLGVLGEATKGEGPSRWTGVDERTGQRYLKLPIPEPDVVQRLAESLIGLLRGRHPE